MKSKLHLTWFLSLVLVFCLMTSNGADPCKFVGTDADGNVVYGESITCDFPVLMGYSVVDSITYENEMNAWFSNHSAAANFSYYYFEIGWFSFLDQSEERQTAMKGNPALYHVTPLFEQITE